MANKNFIVKNGLEVGGQEVVSSSGVVTSAALGGQTLASTDSPTFNNLTLTNDIAVGGDLNLTGDLNITGDVNSVSVTDLDVTDQTITLGAGQVESASGGSGIVVDGSNASILWDETNDTFDINKGLTALGDVGIGTDTPLDKLHVEGTVDGAVQIQVDNQNTGSSSYAGLLLNGQGNNFFIKNWGDSVSGKSNQTEFISTESSSHFVFATASTERMRIASSGNVGINTSSPSGKLEVADSDGGATVFINNTQSWTAGALSDLNNTPFVINTRASGAQLRFSGGTGHVTMQSVTSNLSTAEDISLNPFGGNVGIGTTSPSAKLHLYTAGSEGINLGIQNSQRYWKIETVSEKLNIADVSAGGLVRMSFDTSGDVAFAASATGAALIKGVSGDQTDRDAGGYPQYTFAGNEGTGMRRAGANILAFDAGGSENMRINQTGGLSIDTTNVPANTTGALVLANGGAGGPSTTQPGGGLWIEDAAGTPKLTLYRASGDALRIDAQGDNDLIFDNTGSHGFAFVKGGTTLFGIDESASGIVKTTLPVGIGVTSILSGYKLEVGGSIVIPSASFLANRSSAGSNWGLIRGNDSGTTIIGDSQSLQIAVGGNVTAGGSPYDTEGNLICYGSGQNSLIIQTPDNTLDRGIAWRNSGGAYIANIYVTDAGSNIGDMVFGVSNATQTDVTSVEERMRITSSGQFLFGKLTGSLTLAGMQVTPNDFMAYTNTSTDTGDRCLVLNQQNRSSGDLLEFRTGNSNVGKISLNTSGNMVYGGQSDYRLKENVNYSWSATDKLKQLKPCEFEWKSDDYDAVNQGFLAHEVETVVPQAVVGNKDGVDKEDNPSYQQLDNSALVPLLTKAIQEQQTIIEDLKSRLETLEG